MIGLFYDNETEDWLWETLWEEPTRLSYSGFVNWKSEPSNLTNASPMCTFIGDDGKWIYKECNPQDPIICEYPKSE